MGQWQDTARGSGFQHRRFARQDDAAVPAGATFDGAVSSGAQDAARRGRSDRAGCRKWPAVAPPGFSCPRSAFDQPRGIGGAGPHKGIPDWPRLDGLAGNHHHHPVAQLGDHPRMMRDAQARAADLLLSSARHARRPGRGGCASDDGLRSLGASEPHAANRRRALGGMSGQVGAVTLPPAQPLIRACLAVRNWPLGGQAASIPAFCHWQTHGCSWR